ncbi:MAG: Sensor histidine kinase RcsC [Syntrophus sp. SKADARSKE-3]|nr:Sensor histidine kinase RcsC [Syntrophus sp. SKADARSKE-3]
MKKILVVDDEVSILEMVKEVFESAGYTVLTAESAEEALKILKDDIILVMFLDIRLPGMSGVELCKRIRMKDQVSIIHAFTGYSNIFGLLECRAVGFDDFFVKPVKLDILLKAAQDSFEKLERWKISELM